MVLLLVIVFASVFLVMALLMLAGGADAAQRAKRTLAHLASALATTTPESQDEVVDVRKNELLSAVPWVNRWLSNIELAPRVRVMLYQANLKWTTGGLILMSFFCFLLPAFLVYLRTGSFLAGLIIGSLAGYAPFMYVRHRRNQRFNQFDQGLPEALDLMVGALRAGHSLVAALRLVAHESADPIGSEFRLCFEEQNYGLELRTAMENLVTRVPLQDLRMFATAILIQKESGGNLAEVLDKASNLIRERFKLKRQVRIHTAQGRLTGWILSILPVALGIALYMVSPETISILWRRPVGLKLLYTAAAMTITGSLIIRRIVNMEV